MANLIGMMFKRFNSDAVVEPISLMSASVYYAYTSLLLKSASTNSLDNNTFVDSSIDTLAVTPTGDVTQGSLSPFSPGEWSGYFDGSGDYLTVPASTALQFGTGDFTVEAWINSEALTSTYTRMIVGTGYYVSSADRGWGLGLNTTGKLTFWMAGSSGTAFTLTETVARQLYTWTHVAVTRSGSIVTLWVDGSAAVTGVSAYNENYSRILKIGTSENSAISPVLGNSGASFKGSISNLRIVKGTSVYSESFIPPTSALAIDANTSLLTLNKSNISDMSTNSFNISVVGDTRTYGVGPVNNDETGIGYSATFTRIGGSSVTIPANTNLAFGNENFTIEFWCKINSSLGTTAADFEPLIRADGAVGTWYIRAGNPGYNSNWKFNSSMIASGNIGAYGGTTGGPNLTYGTWQHIAVTRVGTTFKFYFNGKLIGSDTYAGTETTVVTSGATTITIGNTNVSMCNLRIVKGTAVYTGNFPPPVDTLTAITGTILLTLQGSSILDQSANNLSLTLNGGAAMTSGSFLGTIATSGKSVIFTGGSYLRPTDSSLFDISVGDWTLETWINPRASVASAIYVNRASSSLVSFSLATKTTNAIEVYFRTAAGVQFGLTATAANSVPLNAWTHIAVVKSGTSAYIYLNGVLSNTIALSTNVIAPGQLAFVGADWDASYFVGYISNLRLVTGSAVYTTTFTPSTNKLTAISGTVLLLCQDGSLNDQSTNALKIAPYGSLLRSTLGPYPDPWSYYCAFDGSGDYLSVPANGANTIGTSDFTLECWVNPTTSGVLRYIITSHQIGGMIRVGVNSANRFTLAVNTSGGASTAYTNLVCSTTIVSSNTWTHIAVSRIGTSIKLYVDGVADATTLTLAANTNIGSYGGAKPFYIGAGPDLTSYFTGGVSNVRFVKGTGVYTGNFTVPSVPLTAITNTQWLVSRSSGFTDAGPNNYTVTANGNSVMTKLNSASVIQDSTPWSTYFDGSGDYLVVPASTATDILPGSFTVETWIKPNSVAGDQAIVSNITTETFVNSVYLNGASYLYMTYSFDLVPVSGTDFTAECWVYCTARSTFHNVLGMNSSTILNWRIMDNSGTWQATMGGITINGPSVTLNTWIHLALVQSSNTIMFYANGVLQGSSAGTSWPNNNLQFTIGAWAGTGRYFTGNISNVRIVKGTAVYTSNFTVPTSDLSVITNTKLLTCRGSSIVDSAGLRTVLSAGSPAISAQAPTGPGTRGWGLWLSGPYIQLKLNSSSYTSTNTSRLVAAGQWNHLAMTGDGLVVNCYLNGELLLTNTQVLTSTTAEVCIGVSAPGKASNYFSGFMSDLRIEKGKMAYDSAFTPSSVTLPVTTGTALATLQDPYIKDNSTNNFDVTTYGNTKIMNVGPFDDINYGYSAYFDGSGDQLSIADSPALEPGNQNFCIEVWMYPTTSGDFYWYGKGNASTAAGSTFSVTRNVTSFYIGAAGYSLSTSGAFTTNQWNHYALCRSNGTASVFVNGIRVATNSTLGTGSLNNVTQALIIGGYTGTPLTGYLSNFRYVIGNSVYDPSLLNITVPETALTAISGTSLLTLQDITIKDNSTNQYAITQAGNVMITAFGPFKASPTSIATYSNSLHGGSAYFNAQGDKLDFPAVNLAGDFTAETWFYRNTDTESTIFTNSTNSDRLVVTATGGVSLIVDSVNVISNAGTGVKKNSWVHIAWARSGVNCSAFVNGIRVATGTNSATLDVSQMSMIGATAINGYISDARLVNALVTGYEPSNTSITIPTAPLSAVTGTKLLLKMSNAGIYDAAAKGVSETYGNVMTSTTQVKYGPTSIYFDGVGDYLYNPVSAEYEFGTGNFTIETWVYFNDLSSTYSPICQSDAVGTSTNTKWFFAYTAGTLKFSTHASGGFSATTAWTPVTGTWYHVAVTRDSARMRLFIDGVSGGASGTTTVSGTPVGYSLGQNGLSIGAMSSLPSASYLNGYLEDLRITKGVSRYTDTFIPPTEAF